MQTIQNTFILLLLLLTNTQYLYLHILHVCEDAGALMYCPSVLVFCSIHCLALTWQQLVLLSVAGTWHCPQIWCSLNPDDDCTAGGVQKRCLHICKSGLEANLVAVWLNRDVRLPPISKPLAAFRRVEIKGCRLSEICDEKLYTPPPFLFITSCWTDCFQPGPLGQTQQKVKTSILLTWLFFLFWRNVSESLMWFYF